MAPLTEQLRDLEHRMAERTAELEAANQSLAASRRAALTLMEDAVAARDRMAQSSAALRESEQRYRSLFNSMTEGFALHDLLFDDRGQPCDYRFLDVNPAFERLTGLAAERLVGKGQRQILPGEDPFWFETYCKVALTGEPVSFEHYSPALQRHYEVFAYRPAPNQFAVIFSDITERKRTELALQASEERFRHAVVNSPFPMLLHAEDGTVIQASNSWCEISGYTHEELATVGDWAERAYGERRSAVQPDIDALYALDHSEHEGDYAIRTKSGSTRIWDFSSAPLGRDKEGRRLVISMAMDVTERRRAEQSLLESERKLAEAQNMAQLGHWEWDVKTGRVEWSDQVYKIFRLDPKTFTPHIDSILELSPWPEDCARDRELLRKATACHEKGSYEQRFLRPDKSVGHYQSTFQGRYDDQGALVSIVGTVLDITERKQTEEALRRYAERLQNLHIIDQAILHAIVSFDTIIQTALQHLRGLLRCDRASVGIFDWERRQVQVFSSDARVEATGQSGVDLSEEAQAGLELLRQGQIEVTEDLSKAVSPPAAARILQAKGVRACISVPLLSVQGLYGALMIGWEEPRAITDEETEIAGEAAGQVTIAIEQARLLRETRRHAAELEQRVVERTAQLEDANKELEAFSYSVSHDLRAPLRAIDGFGRILREDYAGRLDDEGRRILDVISCETRRMGQLIDDLLAFARLGRQRLESAETDMTALAREVFAEQAALAPGRALQLELSPLCPATVDRSMLRVALVNLLSNAIKFTKPRDPARIEIGCRRDDGQAVYYVKDNGVGFDMRYASKLFGVFQRLHSADAFEGTGVGLALVQRIIHRHGGRVWAEAQVNAGATLFFSLPGAKGEP